MLPSETMIWQPEFTDKTLSRKPGAVHLAACPLLLDKITTIHRVKQVVTASLKLRDYDGQVAEAMAMVRALNKMTKAGMPESVRIAENTTSYAETYPKTDLFNKAILTQHHILRVERRILVSVFATPGMRRIPPNTLSNSSRLRV